MKKLTLGLQTLVASVVLFGLTHSASAGFVPVFVSEVTNGTTSVFTYNVTFASNGSTETLTSGDFFTLYDIGTVAASATAPVFTLSSALTGVTPAFVAPPDSATSLNLTGTYNGATVTANTNFTATFTFLGTLSTRTGYYSSTDTIALGKNAQVGLVTLPLVVVPEPTTCATLALGVVGLAASAMRRRRSA